MNVWRPFWFEGNQAWGLITSADDWRRITEAYAGSPVALMDARRGPDKTAPDGRAVPNYGFRMEHRDMETIREHFEPAPMDAGAAP